MQITQKLKYVAILIAFIATFVAGYKTHESEEVTRHEERTVETDLSKETGEKVTDKKNNKIKVTTLKPDGSTEIVEIDKSEKNTSEKTSKESEKTKEVSKIDTKVVAKSKYRAGVAVATKDLSVSKDDISIKPVYGINLGTRLFGNIWLDGSLWLEKRVELGVSYEW